MLFRAFAQRGRGPSRPRTRALETRGAAVIVPDAECRAKAMRRAMELLADREKLRAMSRNLEALAQALTLRRYCGWIVKVM